MDYKYEPFYKERFDRDFLAFFQYTTGYTFARNGAGDPDPACEFRDRPMLFDPRAEWLLIHQAARALRDRGDPGRRPAARPQPAAPAPAAAAPGAGRGRPRGPGAEPGDPRRDRRGRRRARP